MKIRITGSGIYGAKGAIAVGEEVEVKSEPKGWSGRYDVISGGKTAVTNPAKDSLPSAERKARYNALVEGLSEQDFTKDGAPNLTVLNQLLDDGETPFTAKDRKAFEAK